MNDVPILQRWTLFPVPKDCKNIAIFMDKGIYEEQIQKRGMKPLIEDDFMPVLIAYEPAAPDQKDPECSQMDPDEKNQGTEFSRLRIVGSEFRSRD